MIVGSKYVFHTDNDDDVLSHKINQHICVLNFQMMNYVYPDPLLHGRWYIGTKGLQPRRVQKSLKNIFLFLPPLSILYITIFIAKIYRFYKEAPAEYRRCLGC